MNIKLIVFDLDGVLVDSREHHYQALNATFKEVDSHFMISKKDHLTIFDGLSTVKKLNMLSDQMGLDRAHHETIWRRKQELTFEIIRKMLSPNPVITELFKKLRTDGYKLYVCSNSIRESIRLILSKMGLIEHVDAFISNEDVTSPKPHPEMYWQAMIKERAMPKETLIIEDSYVGQTAALSSGGDLS